MKKRSNFFQIEDTYVNQMQYIYLTNKILAKIFTNMTSKKPKFLFIHKILSLYTNIKRFFFTPLIY